MRILVDENIPNITAHELRALGHDVLDIRGTERQGMLDDELWPFAQTERRMLVTNGQGFLRAPRRAALGHFGSAFAAPERAADSRTGYGSIPAVH